MSAGEQHQAAAGPARTALAQRVRLVGEHVEHPPRRRHRVDVVVGHRRRLVGLDGDAQERAVGQLGQRRGSLLRDRRHERRRVRRLRGDDHLACPDLLAAAAHDELLVVRADGVDTAARAGTVAELAAQRGRQLSGPAEHVARGQRALAAPHEREQPDPAARRELVQLGRGAMRRAREDVVHRRRQRAEELSERAVVLEVVAALEPVIARHRALDLQPRPHERDPVAHRQRQAERVGLDAAVVEDRRADGEAHHAARHRARCPGRTRARSRRAAIPAPGKRCAP